MSIFWLVLLVTLAIDALVGCIMLVVYLLFWSIGKKRISVTCSWTGKVGSQRRPRMIRWVMAGVCSGIGLCLTISDPSFVPMWGQFYLAAGIFAALNLFNYERNRWVGAGPVGLLVRWPAPIRWTMIESWKDDGSLVEVMVPAYGTAPGYVPSPPPELRETVLNYLRQANSHCQIIQPLKTP